MVNGYGILRSKSAGIRLLFYIDNLASLIDAIERSCYECGTPNAFNSRQIALFKRHASIHQILLDRFGREASLLLQVTGLFGLGNFFIGFVLWNLPLLHLFVWTLWSFIVPMAAYSIANLLLLFSLHRQSDRPMLSAQTVRRAYVIGCSATLIAHLVLGVIVKNHKLFF